MIEFFNLERKVFLRREKKEKEKKGWGGDNDHKEERDETMNKEGGQLGVKRKDEQRILRKGER